MDRQAGRRTDRDRQTDRQMSWADRQTDRQTETDRLTLQAVTTLVSTRRAHMLCSLPRVLGVGPSTHAAVLQHHRVVDQPCPTLQGGRGGRRRGGGGGEEGGREGGGGGGGGGREKRR